MRRISVFSALIISFFYSVTFAQMTIDANSVSGYSKVIIDSTDNTIRSYYASFAGSCTADATGLCNSCKGDLKPCSLVNASPSLQFSFRANITGTINSTSAVDIEFGSERSVKNAFNVVIEGSNAISFTTTWGALCSAINGNSDCSDGISPGDLEVSLDGSGGTTAQAAKLQIGASYISGEDDSVYTECSDTDGVAGQGFCHVRAKPGDGKLILEDLIYSSDYPGSGGSASTYTGVIIFYEIGSEGEADDIIFGKVNNKSQNVEVDVTKNAENIYELSTDRISGLSNGQRVCLRIGNRDAAGIIKFFTPTTANSSDYCGTPTEVIGLIDDQSCFIATAAFGSALAPEVQWIRKFRNQFLLTNSLGVKFVKFYYKYSPPFANWIAKNERARTVVRATLWPVLAFSWISVKFGMTWALLFGFLSTMALIESSRLLRRRFKARSQA